MNKIKPKCSINSSDLIKYLHLAIIILGSIFISIPSFHQSLWFDESYSVGIASKSFADIWRIGGNDVHPVLYYWILHIAYLIFGSNIYVYRILSVLPLTILGVIGYTHIKKDFGEKIGVLFSFFTFFLPINLVYSSEIRMYTWGMLFVSIMAIYAYRIYQGMREKNLEIQRQENKNDTKIINKKWCVFAIFSLASAYTHYYGLGTAVVVNAVLFIYLLVTAIKAHKQNKENKVYTLDLKRFTISAVIQILLYIPWLYAMLAQVKGVSKDFWIEKPSIELLLQIFTFQFTGNLDIEFISAKFAMFFSIFLLSYTIIAMVNSIIKEYKKTLENKVNQSKIKGELPQKDRQMNSNKSGFWAIGIYVIVMMIIFVISLKMPILYARYFLNLTGLFIFFMAFFVIKGGKKLLTIIVCVTILIVSTMVNCNISKMNYDSINKEPLAYIKTDLQENDLILFGNEASGFVISAQLPENRGCFYDKSRWDVDAAYEGYGKDGLIIVKTLEPLEEYKGRIWIVDCDNYKIYDELVEKCGKEIQLQKQKKFSVAYHEYQYNLTLIEKQ